MNTIAISRLIGSEAGKVAEQAAKILEYDLVNKSTLEGIFRQYGLTKFGDLYTTPPNLWDLANSKNLMIVSMLNDTMHALAHRGRTIVLGRGCYAPLRKYTDVLNVRLQAPFETRVARVMARENQSDTRKVEQQVKADDKARQKFVSLFYNTKWDNATEFDVVLDTGTIPAERAVKWIVEAAGSMEAKQERAGALSAKDLKVDVNLLDAIDRTLERASNQTAS